MKRSTVPALAAVLALASCGLPVGAVAQQAPIRRADRAEALDTLVRRMDHYVLTERKPAVLARLAAARPRLEAIDDPEAFREAVNAELYAGSRDRHLTIWIDRGAGGEGGPPGEAAWTASERSNGFGVDAVRRLPGNVGYLRLTGFSGHPEAGAAIDRAAGVLADTDGVIIDLRRNGGGGEAALNRLMGHLSAEPPPLATLEMRVCAPPPPEAPDRCEQTGAREMQHRRAEAVGSPAFAGRPIWVLTSARTFSAAEELAYDVQASGLGVVVGETTGGGANPSATMDLGPRFLVIMPIAEARHPLTGGNWEGVGVRPDVRVPADRALLEAYRRALAAPTADPGLAARRAALSVDPEKALRDDGVF